MVTKVDFRKSQPISAKIDLRSIFILQRFAVALTSIYTRQAGIQHNSSVKYMVTGNYLCRKYVSHKMRPNIQMIKTATNNFIQPYLLSKKKKSPEQKSNRGQSWTKMYFSVKKKSSCDTLSKNSRLSEFINVEGKSVFLKLKRNSNCLFPN